MALLCYSDLDDGQASLSTLDGLHASLRGWVFDLLANAEIQDRSPRPLERFTASATDRGTSAERIALQAIQLITYAQEQLLHRNAYIRYLCPDCPRGGRSACPKSRGPRPPWKTTPAPAAGVPSAKRPVGPQPLFPTPSKVVERLHLTASAIEQSPDDTMDAATRVSIVASFREAACQWQARGIDDSAVDLETTNPGELYGRVTLALSRSHNVEQESTDARHSPVNFIAAVLRKLAGDVSSQPLPQAREAIVAALVARNAAIEGDTATVDEFTRAWLGLGQPQVWREAVEAALLSDWVDRLGYRLSQDAEVAELLKRHAHAEHRYLQPLWERKVRGLRLRMLDEPVSENLTLRDTITDRRRPEDTVLGHVEDDRVREVLRSLTQAEKAVAAVYGSSRTTWTQAAQAAGAHDPAALGERVRRKLKRLGAQQARKTAAAPPQPVPR
ncbi:MULTISPECIES: hypothetical protein [unclassified Streptomyces]|uniref:hypothetical protein n=1 Tax=unclassified Streptomyces TaxID=2593676 RepID=UPI00331F9F26